MSDRLLAPETISRAIGNGRRLLVPALCVLAFLLTQYASAWSVPFLNEDYAFLDVMRGHSLGTLWAEPALRVGPWFRPWSQGFHYWARTLVKVRTGSWRSRSTQNWRRHFREFRSTRSWRGLQPSREETPSRGRTWSVAQQGFQLPMKRRAHLLAPLPCLEVAFQSNGSLPRAQRSQRTIENRADRGPVWRTLSPIREVGGIPS